MKFGIGQAVRRTEDVRFVTGNGQYSDDLTMPDLAHVVMVRSPVAHAKINAIGIEDALEVPGVLAVVLEKDLAEEGYRPIPCMAGVKNRDGNPMPVTEQWLLARDKVRYVGHPVAAVIAESIAAGKEAAELVYVDYAMLDAVADVDEAAAEDAPQLWDDIPGNMSLDWEMGDKEGADKAYAEAAHVVELDVTQNRIVVNSMEPRGALAQYDPQTESYTLHISCQGAHNIKNRLAKGIMKIDPDKIRVLCPDVGGGFGMKGFTFPEECVALYAAKKLGRPVKWIGDRSEAFLADTHGRDVKSRCSLALDAEGHVTAMRLDNRANLGCYNSIFGPGVATGAGARVFGGCYHIPSIHAHVRGYLTNTAPVDAYRGAGRPEAAYFVERLMDEAGRVTGLGPVEIRRRNFIRSDEMPYKNWLGIEYDSGQFERIMDEALEAYDFAGFEARRAEAKARGKLRGIGLTYYIEVTGAGREMARLRFTDNGGVQISVGTQSNGQGHETAFAQIAAEKLGLPFESIEIRQGDTAAQPYGGGTGGARSAIAAGHAINAAVDQVVEQGKKIAAKLLEAPVETISFDASSGTGTFSDGDRSVGLAEVVQIGINVKDRMPELAGEIDEGMDVIADNEVPTGSFANGCHVCEVEIDEDTGKVQMVDYKVLDDFGTIINPMIVEGQVHGGVAQGMGQALLENCVYEQGGSGQLVTGSFMDYAMPRADDMPPVTFKSVEDIPCLKNDMGIKGCGEAGTVGSLPATVNAVVDALSVYGITTIDMPCTPEKVWRLIQEARA